jgi:hypothetical protein
MLESHYVGVRRDFHEGRDFDKMTKTKKEKLLFTIYSTGRANFSVA